jgi:long-chain acyl-CoA synthetase
LLAHAIMDNHLYSEVVDSTFEESKTTWGKPRNLQVLGITAVNCEEWVATDMASNLLGITSVPLYETLGAQMMELILAQTEMSTVFGSDKCLLNVLNTTDATAGGQRPQALQFLRNLVVFGSASDKLISLCKQYGILLFSYEDLLS